MPTINQETIAENHSKITIDLAVSDYFPKVEKELKNVAKTIAIKGFRPGMAPVGLVKKMHGNAILADELGKVVNANLDAYLKENNIRTIAYPLNVATEKSYTTTIDAPTDVQFAFEIGIEPEFEINAGNLPLLTQYKINVGEEELNSEINYELTRNGTSEEMTSVEETDVLNIDIKEKKENGYVKAINLLLTKIPNETFRKQLLGLAPEATLDFNLLEAFNNDTALLQNSILNDTDENLANVDLANTSITINKIYRLKKAELDEALFEKVFPGKGIKDEATFRQNLKDEINLVYDKTTRGTAYHDLRHLLLENVKINLPLEFLNKWVKAEYHDKFSDQEIVEQFDSFIEHLKWDLIAGKVITEQKLQISQEDLLQKYKEQLMQTYQMPDSEMLDGYAKIMMDGDKNNDKVKAEILAEKALAYLLPLVNVEIKEVSPQEFQQARSAHDAHYHQHAH